MAKVKVTRKDLKRDELRDFWFDLTQWYEKRRTLVWAVVAAVVLLLVIARAWGNYRENRRIEANSQYSDAALEYQSALAAPDDETRRAQLQTAEARASDLRNRYPGTVAARQALLLQGNVNFMMNELGESTYTERALQQFSEFYETAGSADERATGLISMAYCYEDLLFNDILSHGGRPSDPSLGDQALDFYTRGAEAAESDALKRQAMLGQARIHEVQLNALKAIEIYDEIIAMGTAAQAADESKFITENDRQRETYPVLNPADVFSAVKLAQQQKDRLQTLVRTGEAMAPDQLLPSATQPATAPATQPSTAPSAEEPAVDSLPLLTPVAETPAATAPAATAPAIQ